jgi:hypothetical protein
MKVDEKEIWLIHLYGPNQDDPYFFKNICTNLLNVQATNVQIIMLGDYNTVLRTSMDRKGNHSMNYHHRALKEITNIMDTLEIVNIWRLKTPNLVRYTWRRLNQAIHLGYFLVSFIKG